MSEARPAWVYIVACADGTLYTGWSYDVAGRVARHNGGRGAKYTRSRLPVTLLWQERHPSRVAAMRREAALKRLTRAEKLALVARGDSDERGTPALSGGILHPAPEA